MVFVDDDMPMVGNQIRDGTLQLTEKPCPDQPSFSGVRPAAGRCPAVGSEQVARLFKPYMEFAGAEGSVIHNWDLASNYLISHTVQQFDRSADVLRQ